MREKRNNSASGSLGGIGNLNGQGLSIRNSENRRHVTNNNSGGGSDTTFL